MGLVMTHIAGLKYQERFWHFSAPEFLYKTLNMGMRLKLSCQRHVSILNRGVKSQIQAGSGLQMAVGKSKCKVCGSPRRGETYMWGKRGKVIQKGGRRGLER